MNHKYVYCVGDRLQLSMIFTYILTECCNSLSGSYHSHPPILALYNCDNNSNYRLEGMPVFITNYYNIYEYIYFNYAVHPQIICY